MTEALDTFTHKRADRIKRAALQRRRNKMSEEHDEQHVQEMIVDTGKLAHETRLANLIEVARLFDLDPEGQPERLIAKYRAFENVLSQIDREDSTIEMRRALRDARPDFSEDELDAELLSRFGRAI
jgi:hypothetical protein